MHPLEKLSFRILIKSDFESFFALRLEGLLDSPTAFLSSYDEEKQRGEVFYENVLNSDLDNIIIGGFENNELIGYIGIYQENRSKTRHKANIWGMYIKPNYRNQKIGKRLLELALNHAKSKLHCNIVNISLEEKNSIAKNLYESYNFKTWGIEPKAMHIDGIFYSELHMSLIL